jgi:hypothetical protein
MPCTCYFCLKNGQQILYIYCIFLNFLPFCTNLWVYEGPEVKLGYLQGASYTFGYYLRSCKCLNPSVQWKSCRQCKFANKHGTVLFILFCEKEIFQKNFITSSLKVVYDEK